MHHVINQFDIEEDKDFLWVPTAQASLKKWHLAEAQSEKQQTPGEPEINRRSLLQRFQGREKSASEGPGMPATQTQ